MKKIIECIYYFFYGLLYLILYIPNMFIRAINNILKKGFPKHIVLKKEFSEIKVSRKLVILLIIFSCFSTYFISIFYLTKYYVQQERCKVFSKQIITSTNKIEKEEEIIKENTTTEQTKETNNNQNINTNYYTNNNYAPSYLNYLDINVNNYTKINKDVVAWLKVNGTKINYAIVQSSDNKYYLKKDLYKKDSITGWVFADYRNNMQQLDKNNIIYGHNMANGTMFGTLTKVINKSWYKKEKNQYIALNTKRYKTIWKIFSIYLIEPTTDYLKVVFDSNETYNSFLKKMKSRSIYNFSTDLTPDDKILTLQTCDNSGAKRIVVHAKLYKIEKS